MMKPPEKPEVPEHATTSERVRQILAVCIVVATLGVAVAEFLHSFDARRWDAVGVEAQKLGVERQGALAREEEKARLQVDAFGFSESQRTIGANAFQQFLLDSVQPGSPEAQRLQLEQDRWQQLADFTGELSTVKPTGTTGPQKDIQFPNLILRQGAKESDRLFALQNAANEERDNWERRLGTYAVILTMFAVAAYLFGLSMVVPLSVRRVLSGLAGVLVVAASGWIVGLQFTRPSTAPDAAAEEYAAGNLALTTFYTVAGDGGLKSADEHLTKAIELRSTFAEAYLLRSETRFLLGAADRSAGTQSITTLDALKAQGADLQQAYDLGLRSKQLLNSLATNRILLALNDNQGGLYGDGLRLIDSAVKLDDGDPLLRYNRGLALLGQGNADQARAAYHEAVDRTVYSELAAKKERNDPIAKENLVGGALTSLDLLAQHRGDLRDRVTEMKQLIVSGVEQIPAGAAGAALTDIKVQVFPGELQWTGSLTGFDAQKDTVTTQWYFRSGAKLGWSVLRSVSGTTPPASDSNVGPNGAFVDQKYLQLTSQCLAQGSYRAEVYVDGRIAGAAEGEASFGDLRAEKLTDTATALCRPVDWKQDDAHNIRGFSDGFTSADKASGVYMLRFQNPAAQGAAPAALGRRVRDEALTAFAPIFPAAPQFDHDDPDQKYFLGLSGPTVSEYVYNGGRVVVGSGVDADGAVIIGLVFGPQNAFDSGSLNRVFNSLIVLD